MYNTYSLVQGEAVVDAGRQSDQVPLAQVDADPSVLLVPHIKVRLTVQDVADLIVQVQVFLKEHFQLRERHRKKCESLSQMRQKEQASMSVLFLKIGNKKTINVFFLVPNM